MLTEFEQHVFNLSMRVVHIATPAMALTVMQVSGRDHHLSSEGRILAACYT